MTHKAHSDCCPKGQAIVLSEKSSKPQWIIDMWCTTLTNLVYCPWCGRKLARVGAEPEGGSDEQKAEIAELVDHLNYYADINKNKLGEALRENNGLRARVAELESVLIQLAPVVRGERCPPELERMVNENFWELIETGPEPEGGSDGKPEGIF